MYVAAYIRNVKFDIIKVSYTMRLLFLIRSLCVIPFKMILKIITIIIIDKKYGYLVNGSKNWLIVKSDVLADEAKRVFGDEVNVTTEGQRHLGAVIGSQEFKDQYCREKILRWKGKLKALSEIAKSQPHASLLHSRF